MRKKWKILALLVVLALVVATVAPAQAKWASKVRIVFFPGGPAGGVFAVNVYNGAKQAEADLGCKVDYVWSDWDPQKMIQQFREVVATRPDGICVMGHPGDEAFDPLIDDAESQGDHRHQPEHRAAENGSEVRRQRLRLRRRGKLSGGTCPGGRGRQAAST